MLLDEDRQEVHHFFLVFGNAAQIAMEITLSRSQLGLALRMAVMKSRTVGQKPIHTRKWNS